MSKNKSLHLFVTLSLLSILSIVLSSCSSYLTSSVKEIQEIAGIEKIPEAKDYPEDDGVNLFITYTTYVDWKNQLKVRETIHSAKILFKNVEEYSDISIPIGGDEIINNIAAQIYRPDGTKIVLEKKDFYLTEATQSGVFITDNRHMKFTFPHVEKGSILEYKIETETYDLFNTSRWYIQMYLPTLLNKYQLWVSKELIMAAHNYSDEDLNWNAQPYNYTYAAKPYFSNFNSDYTFTEWVVKNIPPFKPETRMPHPDNFRTYIQFAPAGWQKGWNVISRDYIKYYFAKQLIISDNIKQKAEELTTGCKTEDEKIEKLFRFVAKMRYVAISLGVGGRRPHTPDEVMKNGYGDCKDKSILLLSMLRAVNIDAKPVLILTKDDGVLDPQFPLFSFNHMIVKAFTSDRRDVWMDPTIEYAKAGELSSSCCGINALVLNDNSTSNLEKTPESKSYLNLEDVSINIEIPDDNTVVYDINYHLTGLDNIVGRYVMKDKTKDEIDKLCKSMLKNQFIESEISDFHQTSIDSVYAPFEYGFKIKVTNGLQKQSDFYMLDPNPLNQQSNLSWLAPKERKYPITWGYPYTEKTHIKIKSPGGNLKLKSLPNNLMLNESDLSFKSISVDKNNSEINIEQEMNVNTSSVSPKKFEAIKNFYGALSKLENEKIILVKQ